MITLYGIKHCDTMKKAFAWFDGRGIEYVFYDYNRCGVPEDRLRGWIDAAGWEVLVNSRGSTFRKLPLDRKQSLDVERAIALLLEHSSIIKRPVIETDEIPSPPRLIEANPSDAPRARHAAAAFPLGADFGRDAILMIGFDSALYTKTFR